MFKITSSHDLPNSRMHIKMLARPSILYLQTRCQQSTQLQLRLSSYAILHLKVKKKLHYEKYGQYTFQPLVSNSVSHCIKQLVQTDTMGGRQEGRGGQVYLASHLCHPCHRSYKYLIIYTNFFEFSLNSPLLTVCLSLFKSLKSAQVYQC